ncbi:MAG: hypothetical protein ACFB4I_20415 [Cyanophyceae cyanobacterium]
MPWHPRDKYCWDFWFAKQEQTLHMFFLQARQLACGYNPDKRHNLASVGHAVLTEGGWKEVYPNTPAFAPREGDHWDNLSIWTGSIIQKDGLYYLFYTGRRKEDPWQTTLYERSQPRQIGVAVSEDLNQWRRTPASLQAPVIPNPGPDGWFDGVNWHDPEVIYDEVHHRYYAFVCAHPQESPPDSGGAIAYATSSDLENWQAEPYRILYQSTEFYLTEVPQVFWRRTNDGHFWRLYLLFSPRWSPLFKQPIPVGVTYYVRSQPVADRTQISYDRIPWEEEPAHQLVLNSHAGKLIDSEARYPIFLGFQHEDDQGNFVGAISDVRWAIFNDDGTLCLSDRDPLTKQ